MVLEWEAELSEFLGKRWNIWWEPMRYSFHPRTLLFNLLSLWPTFRSYQFSYGNPGFSMVLENLLWQLEIWIPMWQTASRQKQDWQFLLPGAFILRLSSPIWSFPPRPNQEISECLFVCTESNTLWGVATSWDSWRRQTQKHKGKGWLWEEARTVSPPQPPYTREVKKKKR